MRLAAHGDYGAYLVTGRGHRGPRGPVGRAWSTRPGVGKAGEGEHGVSGTGRWLCRAGPAPSHLPRSRKEGIVLSGQQVTTEGTGWQEGAKLRGWGPSGAARTE